MKAILELSLRYGSGVVTIHDMAARLSIPVKFLEQILLDLKKGGFVQSKRGKIGGYILDKAPSKIKVGDVIRFIDGPVGPIACVEERYSGCSDIACCIFRQIWRDTANAISGVIDNITFEDLVNRARTQELAVNYSI